MNFFPANNDKILIDAIGKYSISLPDKAQIITNLIEKHINTTDISMEDMKEKLRSHYHQLSIFDMEQEMACMGGCFL